MRTVRCNFLLGLYNRLTNPLFPLFPSLLNALSRLGLRTEEQTDGIRRLVCLGGWSTSNFEPRTIGIHGSALMPDSVKHQFEKRQYSTARHTLEHKTAL
jgi:hypothetical protein